MCAKVLVESVAITFENYSSKSVVLRGGDTRKFKEVIKAMGGKWNTKLRGGPGWILPKRETKNVKTSLKQIVTPKRTLVCKTIGAMLYLPKRRDHASGLWKCRESGGILGPACTSLTPNPCGLCDYHHSLLGKEHERGECIHMSGRWYKYSKDGKEWYSCY